MPLFHESRARHVHSHWVGLAIFGLIVASLGSPARASLVQDEPDLPPLSFGILGGPDIALVPTTSFNWRLGVEAHYQPLNRWSLGVHAGLVYPLGNNSASSRTLQILLPLRFHLNLRRPGVWFGLNPGLTLMPGIAFTLGAGLGKDWGLGSNLSLGPDLNVVFLGLGGLILNPVLTLNLRYSI